MPSLNLDPDYFTNPKILRLVGLLGEEGYIIPIRLWCYVAKHHAATGKLAGYSKQEIEQIVGWRGEAERCVDALVAVRLLEKTRAHRPNMTAPQNAPEQPRTYEVHDWGEHAGHIVFYKKRAKSAARARWAKYENATSNASSIDASSNAPTSHPISSHSDTIQKKEEKSVIVQKTSAALAPKTEASCPTTRNG